MWNKKSQTLDVLLALLHRHVMIQCIDTLTSGAEVSISKITHVNQSVICTEFANDWLQPINRGTVGKSVRIVTSFLAKLANMRTKNWTLDDAILVAQLMRSVVGHRFAILLAKVALKLTRTGLLLRISGKALLFNIKEDDARSWRTESTRNFSRLLRHFVLGWLARKSARLGKG